MNNEQQAAFKVIQAIAETIKEAPNGAPLGPMYAACMGTGISYEAFMSVIHKLQEMHLIRVTNNQAFWIAGSLQ